MTYDIIVGRDASEKQKFGDKGLLYLGKQYVKVGNITSLSNKILLDVAKTHVILITGKRGTGKSTSIAVLAEEISSLPEEVSNNLSVIIFDTMGIFWTSKFENQRDEELLRDWSLKPKKLDVDIYTPHGYFQQYKQRGIPTDYSFIIKPNELNAQDWCNIFDIKITDPIGILIEKTIEQLEEKDYSIDDIITVISRDKTFTKEIIEATKNRFYSAKSWGLFSQKGLQVLDVAKKGRVSIIDISCYNDNWNVKALVIGILSKKLLTERISSRKYEELESIKEGEFGYLSKEAKKDLPLVWMFLDEAQEFLPKDKVTPATDALVQLLREGRQPGISLVLATQQPGEIHTDVITQSDIVISHRITARRDIEALNNMMQSYLFSDINKYLNELPTLKGSAIVLDDNSERIYPIRVRPRFSWHGGEAPTLIKTKSKELLDLGF